MMSTKVADLSVDEFKEIIRDTVIETFKRDILDKEMLPYIDDKEQQQLEEMFGKKPMSEEFISEREIEI
ncbi:hypothetical protein H8E88_35415 [candidate division KSB1 bacterium]|nr:hypothetical protein [candidate division KSB1 bacterium]